MHRVKIKTQDRMLININSIALPYRNLFRQTVMGPISLSTRKATLTFPRAGAITPNGWQRKLYFITVTISSGLR